MAVVPLETIKPCRRMRTRASGRPLARALEVIFEHSDDGLWLVGGTALAGFYAGHRRSEDLDLFARDPISFHNGIRAVRSLKKEGARLSNERTTPSFYHADVEYRRHRFTVAVVLDENLHRVGRAVLVDHSVRVVDLMTLFKMKIAALVSRCSEKDLYDLDWLFSQTEGIDAGELVRKGSEIDAGVQVETLLVSLKGTPLRKEACHFLLRPTPSRVEEAYHKILARRDHLIRALLAWEKGQPVPEEATTLRKSVVDFRK